MFSTGGGSGLTLAQPAYPVRVGEQRQLQVVARGNSSSADILTWESSGTAGTVSASGLFTAQTMGMCTVWATYRVESSDPNVPSTVATTNRLTIEVWPRGPSVN
jgi:hypothetical protein